MNNIAKWILESVAATVVIIVCFAIPQALGLPKWTLGLTAFPILLYLSWRLDGQMFSWRMAVLFAALLCALMLMEQEFLPESWRSWSPYLVVFVGATLGSYLRRKRKGTLHGA